MRFAVAAALLVTAAVTAVARGSAAKPAVATLALLTDAAQRDGAVCLDGSPAARYIVRGAEPRKWLVYQQGGGWCTGTDGCAERAQTSLGSSTSYPPTSTEVMQEQGYLSSDPLVSPLMWNWTHVFLPYCDGSSQTGDVEAPQRSSNGTLVFYRGARILRAVTAFLLAEGLANATDVVCVRARALSSYATATPDPCSPGHRGMLGRRPLDILG